MSIMISSSTKGTVSDAVQDIKNQLQGIDVKMLIFFASSKFAPQEISTEMQLSFAKASVFGCSSSGEIVSGKMLKNSVVAMAFDSQTVQDVKVEVVEHLKGKINVNKAFFAFEKYFNEPVDEMDHTKYVGIVLVDGLSGAEEKLKILNTTEAGSASESEQR